MSDTSKDISIRETFIKDVCDRIRQNKRVRRKLPVWGRVHIDRQLPFLCVYRRQRERDDGTERLLFGQPSYVIASGQRRIQKSLRDLVREVASTIQPSFGSFLIVEIWCANFSENHDTEAETQSPMFHIHVPGAEELSSTAGRLERTLKSIRVFKQRAEVRMSQTRKIAPPQESMLLSQTEQKKLGVCLIGLEIRPIYRNAKTGQAYPAVLRSLHRGITKAFRQCFFEFARSNTTHLPAHYQALGRRAVVKAVWNVDRQLAEVSDAFDFLLLATPTNLGSAWTSFRRARYDRAPKFAYRPLPIEPALLKRKLYGIPIELIEDPGIAQVFREKQEELDRKITLLADRNTPRFLYGGIQLYGSVSDVINDLARDLLHRIPPRTRDDASGGHLNARAFCRHAVAEIEYYRTKWPEFLAQVEIRNDIAGLMVSRGKLLVDGSIKIPVSRVAALLQHEVGTHLLTYYNGRAQPFKQLYSGLAGYDESQEGLAVLAEYMAGGLSRPRLRLLAGRVVAVQCLVGGAEFIDTFRELVVVHHFAKAQAFTIAARVYRGGGLTKDAIYLRGAVRVLEYLQNGGSLQPLLAGKINSNHVRFIKELQWRQVLGRTPLQPRYLDAPEAEERLAYLRTVPSLADLVKRRM
jgi:uncharacterized protein (TIGR02421 family)